MFIDFNDLGAGNKPAPVINLFLFSCTSESMGSPLVTEIKYKVCNDHGGMTSCPLRVSFGIDCLELLILLMIAWISPQYPESIIILGISQLFIHFLIQSAFQDDGHHIPHDSLLLTHSAAKDLVQGIFELILETVLCQNDKVLIASNWYPVELVKSKFLKLNYSHIEYVMECFQKNTTKVKNIKKYMLAALFNAPSTIEGYYTAEVNHDMPQFVCQGRG